MKTGLALLALLLGSAALAQTGQATAMLGDATGHAAGRATATQERGGVRVRIEVRGLPAGTHGAHVHMVGRCEGPSFESAGAHWNPMGRQHGRQNPHGAHMGDLPNLIVAANGTGRLSFVVPHASLRGARGILDADGAAVVVHASPDDNRTDPSGNSGARIACGILN